MKRFSMGLLVLVLAGNVCATDWREIYKDKEETLYIDYDSFLTKEFNGHSLIGSWNRIVFTPINTDMMPGEKIKESHLLIWHDCKNRLISNIMVTAFYGEKGENLGTTKEDADNLHLTEVMPSNRLETIHDASCTFSLVKDIVAAKGNANVSEIIKKYPYQDAAIRKAAEKLQKN